MTTGSSILISGILREWNVCVIHRFILYWSIIFHHHQISRYPRCNIRYEYEILDTLCSRIVQIKQFKGNVFCKHLSIISLTHLCFQRKEKCHILGRQWWFGLAICRSYLHVAVLVMVMRSYCVIIEDSTAFTLKWRGWKWQCWLFFFFSLYLCKNISQIPKHSVRTSLMGVLFSLVSRPHPHNRNRNN